MSLITSPAEIVAAAENSGSAGLLGRPAHWERVPLGDVAEIVNGAALSSSGFNTEGRGLPLIRIRDLDGWTGTSYEGGIEKRHEVREGDMLVGMDGDFNLRRWSGPLAVLNQRVCKVRVKDQDLYHEPFLALVLPGYLDAINAATSSITVKHLSSRDLAAIPLPLPPLLEQRRIAEAMGTHQEGLQRLGSELRALLEMLKVFRRSVIAAAVRGKLMPLTRDSGSENSESARPALERMYSRKVQPLERGDWPIPSGWVWTRTGDFFDVALGRTPKRGEPAFWGGSIPWVSSGEVAFRRIKSTNEMITEAGLGDPEKRLHPPGTVMLAMIGEGKTRGQAAILDVAAAHNQNCASIRTENTGVLPEWVYYCLVERYEKSRTMGAGNNQPALTKKLVESIPIPIPPIEEQRQLTGALEQVLAAAAVAEASLWKLERQASAATQSILREAVAGHLVPLDDLEEPAGILLKRIQEAQEKRSADVAESSSSTTNIKERTA